MSKYFQYRKSLLILVSVLTLSIVSCSKPSVKINKSEVLKSIKEIEKSLNEDDLGHFSANTTSTNLNKYFKVLTFYTCILDRYNTDKGVIILTPVSMNESSDDIEVELTISYNGTIDALYFKLLRTGFKKFLQLGMPSEVTFTFQYVDNKYKLSNMRFPVAYETLFYTQGMVM